MALAAFAIYGAKNPGKCYGYATVRSYLLRSSGGRGNHGAIRRMLRSKDTAAVSQMIDFNCSHGGISASCQGKDSSTQLVYTLKSLYGLLTTPKNQGS